MFRVVHGGRKVSNGKPNGGGRRVWLELVGGSVAVGLCCVLWIFDGSQWRTLCMQLLHACTDSSHSRARDMILCSPLVISRLVAPRRHRCYSHVHATTVRPRAATASTTATTAAAATVIRMCLNQPGSGVCGDTLGDTADRETHTDTPPAAIAHLAATPKPRRVSDRSHIDRTL